MKKKNIALAFSMGARHLEQAVRGIRKYVAEYNCPWRLITNPESHKLDLRELKHSQVDGIIAMIRSNEDEKLAKELKVPVINISGVLEKSFFQKSWFCLGRRSLSYVFFSVHK